MKVSLSVLDRLMVLNVLPAENDFTTIKLLRNLKDAIGFNEEESKALNFRQQDVGDGKTKTQWNPGVVADKEFELGERTIMIITEQLKKLNEQKKLTESHIGIYEKVVENGPKD
jgi:hypothetical protein